MHGRNPRCLEMEAGDKKLEASLVLNLFWLLGETLSKKQNKQTEKRD